MNLHNFTNEEIRNVSRATLESLEYWLRRVIDDLLTQAIGAEYLMATRKDGSFLINKRIRETIHTNLIKNPDRYPRPIDATYLGDQIDIICNPNLYADHFSEAFHEAYPDGVTEARTFLTRLEDIRNRLAHAAPISTRQAEKVICYSHDVIDSLKAYYLTKRMRKDFDVPTILKLSDSLGNTVFRSASNPHSIQLIVKDKPEFNLLSGDTITLSIEVDPTCDESSYIINWTDMYGKQIGTESRASLILSDHEVGLEYSISCVITSKNSWHKFPNYDDIAVFQYCVVHR